MKNRTVLITGAGTGIGAACARRLASEGANLVLMGRRVAPLEAVAAETGGLVLAADVASSADWPRCIAAIVERFGGLDGVIANAGGHGLGSATDTGDDDWQAAMRANLDSAFHTARACLPLLVQRRGSMVLMASIAALASGEGVCGYTTAKHALIGLTRSLARDYGPQGVRVNAVSPGWVRTPMADAEMQPLMERHGESLDAAYARVTAEVPLRRPASPEEIASVCRFLLGEESAIVTGINLVADGGSSIVDVPTLAFGRG
ncbi:SDR family NAD(P)-dependent oxidoreductase [Metapseudomonas furukawaii]